MSSEQHATAKRPAPAKRNPISRFRKNVEGTTAIEFGMVAMPFLMMLFGILAIGLFFFTTFSLENAVERAGRLIRTGQVASANMTEAQFKTEVCNNAPAFVDCNSKLRVFVQSFDDTAGSLTPAQCLDGTGSLTSATGFDIGEPDKVVLVTACYEWDLTASIPFLNLGNMGSSGKRLIQAVSTFRTEPYTTGGS